ncbi:MAG TPA: acyl-CoA thioesterase [Trueperaceae bacterium]
MDDPLVHSMGLTVSREDTDELGHVNNAVYLMWVDECCRAHVERLGMPLKSMMSFGVLPVVRRHVATYRSSAVPGDRVVVSTRVVRARGALATRHNEVRRDDDELLVEVDTIGCGWTPGPAGPERRPPR